MAKAFDINVVFEYVLKADRDEEETRQTKFTLGVLDSRLTAFLNDRAKSFGVNPDASAADDPATVRVGLDMMHWNAVRFGIRNWSNLLDGEGVEVKCLRKPESLSGVGTRLGLTPESMDRIKPYIRELAREIFRLSEVTEGEREDFP